jgi:hypothetical protein
MSEEGQIYEDLRDECILVSAVSSEWTEEGIPTPQTAVLCGAQRDDFLEDVKEIVEDREWEAWDLREAEDYGNALLEAVKANRRAAEDRGESTPRQSVKVDISRSTGFSGTGTWTTVELDGEVDGFFTD